MWDRSNMHQHNIWVCLKFRYIRCLPWSFSSGQSWETSSDIHDQPLDFGFHWVPQFWDAPAALLIKFWRGMATQCNSSSCPQAQHHAVLARKGRVAKIRTYFPSWFSWFFSVGCIAAGAQGRDFDFIDWRSPAEILSLPQFLLKAQWVDYGMSWGVEKGYEFQIADFELYDFMYWLEMIL